MSILPTHMKALQLLGLHKLVMTELPLPSPGKNEVLIRTTATTICTSDLHDIKSNPFGIKFPRVLGHEGAGVVEAFGSAVHHLPEGERVAAHPVVPCGVCAECVRGFSHICSNMGHLGYDRDGTFAEYFVQRADRVRALPESVPSITGVLLEPVAVCLQAIARAGEIKDRSVLIVGDGPFGNIIARLAIRAGAGLVTVSGKEPFRLGKIPGVTIAHEVPTKSFDIAILAVSAPAAVTTCITALRPRGRMVVFSTLTSPVPVDLFAVHLSEFEIVGCCNDENRLDESLLCLSDPGLALDEIITHQFPFESWQEAFTLASEGHGRALKVALSFQPSPIRRKLIRDLDDSRI